LRPLQGTRTGTHTGCCCAARDTLTRGQLQTGRLTSPGCILPHARAGPLAASVTMNTSACTPAASFLPSTIPTPQRCGGGPGASSGVLVAVSSTTTLPSARRRRGRCAWTRTPGLCCCPTPAPAARALSPGGTSAIAASAWPRPTPRLSADRAGPSGARGSLCVGFRSSRPPTSDYASPRTRTTTRTGTTGKGSFPLVRASTNK
jgi:hypothetical protein